MGGEEKGDFQGRYQITRGGSVDGKGGGGLKSEAQKLIKNCLQGAKVIGNRKNDEHDAAHAIFAKEGFPCSKKGKKRSSQKSQKGKKPNKGCI